MSPYLKGGGSSAKMANRMRYFATRPGVEMLREEPGDLPATKKQQAYIRRLLRSFPDAKELLEYEDYLKKPTQLSASEFIQQARENFVDPMSQRENYLDYVSHRPGVELRGEHGLWTSGGKVENLAEAVREVAEHTGNVWTPVVAIRRQDAERLGYDSAENWRALVNACLCDIAKGYKIHPDHLRWYAAFHRKEHSVHIHMVIFSTDPKEGYLTKDGIQQVKSAFARRIFQQDLMHVYEQKTEYRSQLQQDAAEAMAELIRHMREGTLENPQLEQQMVELARRLQTVRGKKVYGYLPPEVKLMVDGIVDALAADERVAEAYDLWNEMREAICRTYSEHLPERQPLSKQKEFKPVRNMVIREALLLGQQEVSIAEEPERGSDIAPPQPAAGTAIDEVDRVYRQEKGHQEAAEQSTAHNAEYMDHNTRPSPEHSLLPAAQAVSKLFYHMSRIFEDNCKTDAMHRGLQIDCKRRQQLRERRLAMGHKPDDHENEEIGLR